MAGASGEPRDYDVVVVGGAFAGSATALRLKRSRPSLRVAVIEAKKAFDWKVGESSIELSAWFLTRGLGLDRHLTLQQLPKYGQRFWFTNEQVRGLADASELGNRYQSRVPSFHIDRAVLDEHVQSLAVGAGADLVRPARVVEIELNESGRSTLQVECPDGRRTLSARWIVDATGRKCWLARQLNLWEPLHEHPTRAVWARYQGTRDFDGPWLGPVRSGAGSAVAARGLSTNHLTGPGYWIWAIPLPGGQVSVGVVYDDRICSLPEGATVLERFEGFLRSIPAGRELMEKAVRCEGDLFALNHLPYRVTRLMGDGWAIVGDAAGFIDPFYSPGLDWASLTISSSTQIIESSLAEGPAAARDTAARIERHNRDFTRGFMRWFRAIYLDKYYYMGDFELMNVALRMDVSLYYFGVVTPPYRDSDQLAVPFSNTPSIPFYHLMAFVNRRLARLAKLRLAAGSYGRHNAHRRALLGGFKLGPSSLRLVPGALARLARLEMAGIPDWLEARRRRRRAAEARRRPEAAVRT